MTDQIPLSAVLDHIAGELIEADTRAKYRGTPIMAFDECEIEFSVNIETSAGAGIKMYVVNLDESSKKIDSNKVKIKFKKIDSNPMQARQETQGDALPAIRHRGEN